MPTESFGPFSVSHGDVTTHDISQSGGEIDILSAQIRWEGITKRQATGNYNEASSSTTGDTTTENNINRSNTVSTSSSNTLENNIPTIPWWGEKTQFDKHVFVWEVTNNTTSSGTITVNYKVDGSQLGTIIDNTWDFNLSGGETSSIQDSTDKDLDTEDDAFGPGAVATMTVTSDGGINDYTLLIQTYSYYQDDNSFDASQTPPPSPDPYVSGYRYGVEYTPDHSNDYAIDPSIPGKSYDDRWVNGNYEFGSGDTPSYGKVYSSVLNSNGTVTAIANARTYGADDFPTTDPSVARDVSSSYSGTISDGTWSTWQPLNNLTPNGNEEFYHNISGSQKADFEFEYTWEYSYPTATGGYWNIYDADQNAIHRVALADPTDSLLDYNHHRFAVGGTVYALDVVDPTDGDAIEWRRWYHPTHGIYCPRASQTITL